MLYHFADLERGPQDFAADTSDPCLALKSPSIVACALLAALMVICPNASAGVVISEFMASNELTLEDEDGDDSDWIELHNDGASAVDLTGWYLTDDDADLTQWQFPSVTLEAGAYLVIFASKKDRSGSPLHSNFKLSAGGEYLGLIEADGVTVADEFAPEYPQQYTDISYGFEAGGGVYFNEPTPGAANSTGFDGVTAIDVGGGRGFYTTPQTISLTTTTAGATLHYTLDGNDPREPGSATYTAPINIDRTTVVRAVAMRDGYIASPVETHTLIFAADVIHQTTMNRAVTADPVYAALMLDSLTSLPSISIVTRKVINADEEVETSLEWLMPDNSDSFAINAGVRNYGNASLNAHPKNHMRLYFRGRYGASKLEYPLFEGYEKGIPATDTFDQLNLRTGSHDSPFWSGRGFNYEPRGSYLRSRWSDDTMLAMGHKTTHGRYVHVYLNGVYWGQHHLRERFNDDFLASYFGGDSDQYEMINEGIASDGDGSTWETIKSLSNNWQQVRQYLDQHQFVDYMILNLYAGNVWDWWAQHNWRSGGFDGVADPGWQFFNSDQDITLQNPATDLWDESQCQNRPSCTAGPDYLWQNLRAEGDPDLKTLFADRIYAHLFDDGVLTPARVDSLWMARRAEIESSMVAETARWGNGQLWQQITGGLKHVSFGIDGSIWGVNVYNHTYRRRALSSRWERMPGEYVHIDALDYQRAIAVNDADQIFHFDGTTWTQINGGLKRVSFGIDGSIWGVNVNNNTYRRRSVGPESAWQSMGVSYVDIDALDFDRAVVLTAAGEVDVFDGSDWNRNGTAFADISYAIDGSLWGIRTDNTIVRQKRLSRPWQAVAGNVAQIDGLYWDQAMAVQSDDTIHHYSGTDYDYQRDDEWDTEIDRLRQTYFPFRTATVVQQFRDQGWYPDLDPAALSLSASGALTLSNPNPAGTLWYTTDGSDPRLSGGAISGVATSCPSTCTLTFPTPTEVRVRVRDASQWSAIVGDTATGAPSMISITDTSVSEGDGQVAVTLSVTPPASEPISVGVHTRADTAQGGQDFYGFTQTVSIAPGVGEVAVALTIIDDSTVEQTETLLMRIFDPQGGEIETNTAVITIADNDSSATPRLTAVDTVVDEGVGTAQVTVELDRAATAPVSVGVYTQSQSAQGGQDYYGFTRSIEFAVGETARTVAVSILDDTATEPSESLIVRLFNPVGAVIDKAVAAVTIEDNDNGSGPATVSLSDATVNEADANARVTVTLSRPASTATSVRIHTRSGTAQGGADFYGFTRTLNFAPGETQQTVDVRIIDDAVAETPATETLQLRLIDPAGLTIADGVATVTIEDDD